MTTTDTSSGPGALAPGEGDAEARRTAADWYGGARPAMLVYAGVGTVVAGLDREIWECLDLLASDERGSDDPVVVAEHERLVVLWHRIEPATALLQARRIGRNHAEAAVTQWQHDTLGRRATGDTTALARRVLGGIATGDPEVLDSLPGPTNGYTITALQADCDWQPPLIGDETTQERWHSVWTGLWNAYENELRDAVGAGVAQACEDALDDPDNSPAAADARRGRPAGTEPDERDLARARHVGAWAALAEATAPRMTPTEAWAVIARREHPFVPPALAAVRASAVRAAAMACAGSELGAVTDMIPEQRGAIHPLVARAWQTGRDAVWPSALSATAMRTIGTPEPAEFLVRVAEDRLRALAEAVDGQPGQLLARPYVRPILQATSGEAKTTIPEGWVAQPIDSWYGPSGRVRAEVVYDPRRHDITITTLGNHRSERLLKADGWERREADGLHVLWTHDRIDTARKAIVRIDQRNAALSATRPTQMVAPPAQGLEL
jgi:hypothetical protein